MIFQKAFGEDASWSRKLIAYVWSIAFNNDWPGSKSSQIPAVRQSALVHIYLRPKIRLKKLSEGFRSICPIFAKPAPALGSLYFSGHNTKGQKHIAWGSALSRTQAKFLSCTSMCPSQGPSSPPCQSILKNETLVSAQGGRKI